MVNEITRDVGWMGDIAVKDGQVAKSIVGRIARTDTTAKPLGVLPAGSTVTGIQYSGDADSDAATTAVLNVGYAGGNGHELIAAADVKGSGTGIHATVPPNADQAADEIVTGIYAETGTASENGGPWLVKIDFLTNAG